MELEVYIAIGALFLALIAHVVRVTWKAREVEKEIREDFDAHIENLERDVAKIVRENQQRTETLRHEAGEMGAAIRQKLHEIEVYARDTFVRKDAFEAAVTRLENSFERGVDKLEDKIDKAIDRLRVEK